LSRNAKKADKTELSVASLIADATLFNKDYFCSYFCCWSHFKAKN